MKKLKIAVAGTGYVGLSIATLLAQHHTVYAVDILPEKVELINQRKSPIQDEYIEKYETQVKIVNESLAKTDYKEIKEALMPKEYNLIVTPKEIDDLIENMKDVVAMGINNSL